MTPKIQSIKVRFLYPFLVIVTLCVLIQCNSSDKANTNQPIFPETWYLLQEESFGQFIYLFGYETVQDGDSYYFYLIHANQIVAQHSVGERTKIISIEDQSFLSESPSNLVLHDLNQDGNLELIVQSYSGGAHCCYEYWIYSLGKSLHELAYLQTKDSPLMFEDIDLDGIFEAKGVDKSFAYWQTNYANSPSPAIILTFAQNGLVLDIKKMYKTSPSQNDLNTTIMRVRSELGRNISPEHDDAWQHAGIPTAMWAHMLELIYTGNGNVAWDFFDSVWRDGVSGKKEFRTAFEEIMRSSPYWDGIRELNGW